MTVMSHDLRIFSQKLKKIFLKTMLDVMTDDCSHLYIKMSVTHQHPDVHECQNFRWKPKPWPDTKFLAEIARC